MLLGIIITTLAVLVAAYLLPGVTIRSPWTALWFSILLGIINGTIGAILQFLATPLNWLTLGLVGFVINVLMIMLVDKLVPGITIKSFWWAVAFAIIVSLVSNIFRWVF